jgi:hypothetical protein
MAMAMAVAMALAPDVEEALDTELINYLSTDKQKD